MITVIKVIDNQIPTRIQNIYNSIFGRTSSYYSEYKNIVFIEKNTMEHSDWIKEHKIRHYPTTLFYKDEKCIAIGRGIMASTHIIETIEPYISSLKPL